MMFLYVFSEEDANTLIQAGQKLVKSDKCNSIFVFVYDRNIRFDLDGVNHVFSNVLTF